MKPKGILQVALAMAAMSGMGMPKIKLPNNNPHNYPLFEIDGYKFYAINEASAQAQYDKIMRKKRRLNPANL